VIFSIAWILRIFIPYSLPGWETLGLNYKLNLYFFKLFEDIDIIKFLIPIIRFFVRDDL
jgi:hypothetical protein